MNGRSRTHTTIRWAVLLLAAACALVPVYWTLNTSLKLEDAVASYPPHWLPNPLTTGNYESLLGGSSIPRNYLNSIILAGSSIFLTLVLGAHAGYAAARFNFRGKSGVLFLLLMTVMIPGIVTLIPQYLLAVQLGLYDTKLALILIYSAWQLPTVVWIMKGFFEGIPAELEDSARVDGCTALGAFYRVVVPLSWPGLAAAAIVVFVWVWNEFIIAVNLTASEATQPLTVGLYFFVGETGIEWGRMTAAAICALLPVIAAFLLLQRRFVEGLTAGALKG
jgi:multiple sugar transport system permease protein